MLRLRGQNSFAQGNTLTSQSAGVSQGTFLKFLKGELVYDQGDPATYWYEVISGTVRTCFNYSDGHRQLTGFFYPGDVFGIEQGMHKASAEAVTKLVLRRIDRACTSEQSVTDTPIAHSRQPVTHGVLESALDNAQDCIFLLGHRTATERIAAFLLATSRRMGVNRPINLPMSRADIADHLGLTVHTVSRTLSDFVRRALITLDGPQIVHILDRGALMHEAGREAEDVRPPACKPFLAASGRWAGSGTRSNIAAYLGN